LSNINIKEFYFSNVPIDTIETHGVVFPKHSITFKNTRILYVIVSLWV